MKLLSVKHRTVFRAQRVLPIGISGVLAMSLVVACGKPDGGKEYFKPGATPPANAKPSSKRIFNTTDDESLNSRLLGVSVAAVASGEDAKRFDVTAAFVIADASDPSKARKLISGGAIAAGSAGSPAVKPMAQAPSPAQDQSSVETDALVTSAAPANTAAQAAPAAAPEPKYPGEPLTLNQQSSPGFEKYRIRAACEDAPCNTLHILLVERDVTAEVVAAKDATQKTTRSIRLAFTRTGGDGSFKLSACPGNTGEASAAQESIPLEQQKALRARGLIVAKGATAGTSAAPSNACAQIASFDAASSNPGSGRSWVTEAKPQTPATEGANQEQKIQERPDTPPEGGGNTPPILPDDGKDAAPAKTGEAAVSARPVEAGKRIEITAAPESAAPLGPQIHSMSALVQNGNARSSVH